jgi:hypothetical protein
MAGASRFLTGYRRFYAASGFEALFLGFPQHPDQHGS